MVAGLFCDVCQPHATDGMRDVRHVALLRVWDASGAQVPLVSHLADDRSACVAYAPNLDGTISRLQRCPCGAPAGWARHRVAGPLIAVALLEHTPS